MANASRALLNLRIFCIAFIVCNLSAVVSSIANDTESGPWCSLPASPDTVGSMECKFDEEVQYIQVDYYSLNSTEPPAIAVSCDQNSCEPNANFADMLKVRGSPSKQLLTLTVHGVPQKHAGRYRCQAQSTANSQTKEGMCSLRFPNTGENVETTGASNNNTPVDTPTQQFNPLILLVLLVVPLVAIIIGIVICKVKNCGPCKKTDEGKTSDHDVESPEEKKLLRQDEKGTLQRPSEEDENEQEKKEEAVELEEGKTTNENENEEDRVYKDEKEEKNNDDDDHDHDHDDEKSEEGNDSSSEQKDGDITEATPGDSSVNAYGEKVPIIATDEDGKNPVVRYTVQ